MKKIIFIILSFLLFTTSVKASTYIYLGDKIPDVLLYLKTPTKEMTKGMYQIINRDTNELLYCIEPGIQLIDGYFNRSRDYTKANTDLTEEEWNYINLITIYGYGYQDRTDLKWYVATQFMIWDYLIGNEGEIYFIDAAGNKINPYEEEINTITNDIKTHELLPSFINDYQDKTIHLKQNEEYVFTDEYNILDKIKITASNTFNYKIAENKLTVSFPYPGPVSINLAKDPYTLNGAYIYYQGVSQKVISRGIIYNPNAFISFEIDYPSLYLTKETDHDLSVSGATYGVYTSDDSLFAKLTINNENEAFLEKIYNGKYYLQEISAPYGYELNPEKIYFEVKDQDVYLKTKDELIYKEIILEKYLEDYNKELSLESNASFDVYNTTNEELILSFTTNEYGKSSFNLPYGNYIIKQTSGEEGYFFSDDIYLTINDLTEDKSIITVKNKEITGSIKIEKRDSLTKDLIANPTTFKILNLDTGEYLKINNNDTFSTTSGILELNNLPYGKYQIEEITPPKNYQLSNDSYYFEITNNECVTIEILNELVKSTITIEKLDYDTLNPLSGVLFGLYNEKLELIREVYTNDLGISVFDNLDSGKYFLKELATTSNYELISDYIEVNVLDNTHNHFKITNRLKIEVPKTGTNEALIGLLMASFCLLIGIYICNHE